MYILIFVLVLGLVVLVHEFGHFIFARRAGILCHEFSIGMGPALYKVKRGETTYAIRAIPIGGYVSMAGEDPEVARIKKGQDVFFQIEKGLIRKIYFYHPNGEDNIVYGKVIDFDLYGKDGEQLYIHYESDGETHFTNVSRDCFYIFNEKQEMQIAPYERCFESKSWINRFLTVVMGAGFNFLLAILLFIIINLAVGVPTNDSIIGSPSTYSPAERLGLESGDEILAINGNPIDKWNDISNEMDQYQGGEITLKIKRDGEIINHTTTPMLFIASLQMYSSLDDSSGAVIGEIAPNSNADKQGLMAGDKIINIKGTRKDDKNTKNIDETESFDVSINNWDEAVSVLKNFYLAERIQITYERNGVVQEPIEVNTIKALEPANVSSYVIGISPLTEFRPLKSIGRGFVNTAGIIGSVFQTLDLLFTDANVSVSDLAGPVGIYDMTKTVAMTGFLSVVSWVAFISANIGFVNLLPLPALDGGRLIFLVIEGISRKPVNRKVEGYIHTVGFILFMALFLYITFNDILRISG